MSPLTRLTAGLASQAAITLERVDPLAAAAARPVTTGAAILSLAIPVITVSARPDEVVQPVWFVVALVALAAAVWLMLDRSHVTRPVWRAPSAQVLQVLLITMAVASILSTYGANQQLRDDWAPLVIGVVLIALTPYRPACEILFWAAAHTLILAALGALQAPFAQADLPTLTFAVTGSLSVAVMGFAAAAYAHALTTSVQRWHERAWAAAAEAVVHERGGVARSVQQQRITLLNREVVPYLTHVVENPALSHADRDDARRLARSIRTLLVADVERRWAQTLLADLVTRNPRLTIAAHADDPDDVGGAATLQQRTVIRAIAETSIRRLAATELHLRLRAPEGRLQVCCTIVTPQPRADARRELRGLIEIVRGSTERLRVTENSDRIVLEFAYGN